MLARPRNAARLVAATIMFAALAANACRFGAAGLPTATASPSPATSAAATPAARATLAGRAVLADLVGDVSSRAAGSGKDLPATNGQTVNEGDQVRTGTESKAKATLGDGTILRLRPDTLVTLDRLITDPNNPVSQLLLALGKVFVILKGGQLEVQTPAGVAAVTGSFMSVEYQAGANSVVVTCLEGNCTLRNDQGGATLTTGQAASLSGAAGSSPVLRWMTPAEIQGWLDDNPEAQAVAPLALTAIPTATSVASATSTATPTTADSATPTETATVTATATPTATSTRKPRPTPANTPTPPPSATPVPPTKVPPSPTPVPGGLKPTQVPTSTNVPQPLVYSFMSVCIVGQPNFPGNYHVVIDGPQQAAFTVMPQQTVNGQLAPGQYSISWQADNGTSAQMAWNSNQGQFTWTFCGKP